MKRIIICALALMAAYGRSMSADADSPQTPISWDVAIMANGSTGQFAPYFIGSLNHGKNAQKGAGYIDAFIGKDIAENKRFSWGFGTEALVGAFTSNDYDRWQHGQWTKQSDRPGAARLQQLYGEVKYRSLFLTAGLKEHGTPILNQALCSGDLVQSGNSRPIPEVRAGFIDFQDIPFTNGWVQIQGELSLGKMMDKSYIKDHFNYYSYHYNLGAMHMYRRCYFRTKPSKPLSVTVGMQAASMYGGTSYFYADGEFVRQATYSRSFSTFLKVLIPHGENGEDYYMGSTLGSWDLRIRYRLQSKAEIIAYFQGPWEDGSSIGRMNRWDGVWGLEYKGARQGWLTGAVVEYLDFRDQCGPIHWAPHDSPGTAITSQSTGRDNYYNNSYYNSYAYYGQAIGTPFLLSPIYNLDGFPGFACNRANGFHAGLSGQPANDWAYRLLASWQRGLGTYTVPYYRPRHDFSMMLEANWNARALLPGLRAKAQVAFDAGSLRGNNFGASITISYSGIL